MARERNAALGKVYLVGAGPGDPGLITVRGLALLESADVVVSDRLVDEVLLSRARPDAELLDVGKVPGTRKNPQSRVNALLVAKAKEGKAVVRLKGGDPFVFGRGGEEAAALADAGIPFEVVPGVTSAVAAPAYAGIPLTHRDYASSLTVITGSEAPDKPDSNVAWGELARAGGTLVILMGWRNLDSIVDRLVEEGLAPDTPAAVVRWGTEPYQQIVTSTVSNVAQRAREAGLSPPVIVVIGEVVNLRDRLKWFESRPLFGKRVLVTRSRTQASSLARMLAEDGAMPIEIPTIEVRPLEDHTELDEALSRVSEYDWTVFTSTNAVEAVFGRLQATGKDARAFSGVKVAAIGSATARELRQRGISADFIPDRFVSESVVEGMAEMGVRGASVLLPRTDIGRETLPEGLKALGARVHVVVAYRTVPSEEAPEVLESALTEGVDVATFTSSSTVTNLVTMLGGKLDSLGGAKIACIGPVTSQTARAAGLDVDIEAREHTVAGLVEALRSHYNG